MTRIVALHWRQNSCPGIILTFLVFNCSTIWRVITCSPLTLWRCFINTPHHLLSLLSKMQQMVIPFSFTFNSPAIHKYVSASARSKASKFLIPQFLVKCSKLYSVFKILSKSLMLDIFNFKCVLTIININYGFLL